MSDASEVVVRRTFVEIFEPEDANRRGGSCPPNISRDKVGTRMAAEALLSVCHKMKAELIMGKQLVTIRRKHWLKVMAMRTKS